MHLLVLSAFRPDEECMKETLGHVSMHLLVLSAFRQENSHDHHLHPPRRLNAPSGAQCFPTRLGPRRPRLRGNVSMHLLVLSAFRQDKFDGACRFGGCAVSMHLLVLSAFRRGNKEQTDALLRKSQCTFWCSVLSDPESQDRWDNYRVPSQCTFWCSVLSDK